MVVERPITSRPHQPSYQGTRHQSQPAEASQPMVGVIRTARRSPAGRCESDTLAEIRPASIKRMRAPREGDLGPEARKACATVHEAKLGGSSCCIPLSTVSYRMVSCDVRDIENGRFGGRGCASIAATHGSEREREDIRWCRAASQPETAPSESPTARASRHGNRAHLRRR